jgi:hypothetical protein
MRILLACCSAAAVAVFASAATARTTLFAIGDTGDCATVGAEKVSAAIRAQSDWQRGWLVEVGDLAYPAATRQRLAECHEPHFGMFERRLAVPGNHDWSDPGARGFFNLFPDPVPRAVRLDERWQIWLLDSNLGGDAWARQLRWLEDAGKREAGRCIVAAWHHPRWTSGVRGGSVAAAPLWQGVADIATLTLHGHDHHYEAMPPLDRAGREIAAGTRSFIVGNGGAKLFPPRAGIWNSKVVSGQWGFLRLDLDGDRYTWKEINAGGETIDAGEGSCLNKDGRH